MFMHLLNEELAQAALTFTEYKISMIDNMNNILIIGWELAFWERSLVGELFL